jgi:hypothetical protein
MLVPTIITGFSNMEPVVMLVKVWYRPVYKCAECGFVQAGTGADVSCDTLDGVKTMMKPVPNHMPVGWASYGRHIYKCPDHKA